MSLDKQKKLFSEIMGSPWKEGIVRLEVDKKDW